MWNDAPRSAASPISTMTWSDGQHERHREVADHQVGPRDRRRQQLALRAAVAVDDHAEPGEDAAQRDDEPDRADADERLVVDVRVQAAGRDLERRRHDQREERRAEQRHEDLPGVAGGERRAAPREGRERAGVRARRGAGSVTGTGSAIADIVCLLLLVSRRPRGARPCSCR